LRNLSYTLVADGRFDRVLRFPINWLLEQWANIPVSGYWADPNVYPKTNQRLQDKIANAVEYYPCELIFIHRDSETKPRDQRVLEIKRALDKANVPVPPAVCIIPVRMTEAWLLFNEERLRQASGNPRGRQALDLQKMQGIESIADPKALLHRLLRDASGATGRRKKLFNVKKAAYRLAELVDDFSILRGLAAFDAFEKELQRVLKQNGWLREKENG